MPDRGDDRHRAIGDRAHEALVAERQQVFEAATAAGEHDHVDPWRVAQRSQRADDLECRPRALHVRLGDEYVGGWETGLDRGQDVALRRRVVARDEPDSAGQEREAALAVGREQSLCC